MNVRKKRWLVAASIYALFVFYYTDFGGPLSDKEITQWTATMQKNGYTPERIDYYKQFLRDDSGRQFLMLNAIDLNENPPSVTGAEPGESADQLMRRYLEHIIPEMLKRACHPVVVGDAVFSVIDIVGIKGGEEWDQAALFRYRSRRDFMEIIANPALKQNHQFKIAALDKTIAYPIEVGFYVGDLRFILALLIFTITALLDAMLLSRQLKKA